MFLFHKAKASSKTRPTLSKQTAKENLTLRSRNPAYLETLLNPVQYAVITFTPGLQSVTILGLSGGLHGSSHALHALALVYCERWAWIKNFSVPISKFFYWFPGIPGTALCTPLSIDKAKSEALVFSRFAIAITWVQLV